MRCKVSSVRSAGCGLILIASLAASARADVFTSVQNGDWSDTNTWGAATVPGSNDTVTIQDGYDVMVGAGSPGVVSSVVLAAHAGRSSLTLQRALTVAGTFQMNGNDAQSDLFLNGFKLTANQLHLNDLVNQKGQEIDRGAGGTIAVADLTLGWGNNDTFTVVEGDVITGTITKTYNRSLVINADISFTAMNNDRGSITLGPYDISLSGNWYNSLSTIGSTVNRTGIGTLTIGGNLDPMYRGYTFNMLPGDTVAGNVSMRYSNNEIAQLILVQNARATTGLTIDGTIDFSTDNDNRIALAWDAAQENGVVDWVFRSGTYSAAQVRGWLNSSPRRLYITATATGMIFDENRHIFESDDGYTYVGYSNAAVVVQATPEIRNTDALPVFPESAQFNSELVSTGFADTVVWLFWGTSDGVTNASAWGYTNKFLEAQELLGTKSTNIVGLLRGTNYFYRFWSSNSYGQAWSTNTVPFTTAVSATFTTLASGDWTTKTLWDPYGTPSGPDTVIIRSGHDVAYDAASPGAAATLTLQDAGSSLTLAKDLSLSGNVLHGGGTTIDFGGYVLDAGGDWAFSGTLARTGGGSFGVGGRFNYYLGSAFTFDPDDSVNQLWRTWGSGAIYTTSTNNLAGSILDFPHPNSSSSTIYLGADAIMSGYIQQDRWQFHLQGNSLTLAGNYEHGYQSGTAPTVRNPQTGTIDIGGNLRIRRGKVHPALPGDIVRGNIEITNEGGTVELTQPTGAATGLTLLGNVSLAGTSVINLDFDATLSLGLDWVLSWQGSHTNELANWYDSGVLNVTMPPSLTFDTAEHIFEMNGYTYIGYFGKEGVLMMVR